MAGLPKPPFHHRFPAPVYQPPELGTLGFVARSGIKHPIEFSQAEHADILGVAEAILVRLRPGERLAAGGCGDWSPRLRRIGTDPDPIEEHLDGRLEGARGRLGGRAEMTAPEICIPDHGDLGVVSLGAADQDLERILVGVHFQAQHQPAILIFRLDDSGGLMLDQGAIAARHHLRETVFLRIGIDHQQVPVIGSRAQGQARPGLAAAGQANLGLDGKIRVLIGRPGGLETATGNQSDAEGALPIADLGGLPIAKDRPPTPRIVEFIVEENRRERCRCWRWQGGRGSGRRHNRPRWQRSWRFSGHPGSKGLAAGALAGCQGQDHDHKGLACSSDKGSHGHAFEEIITSLSPLPASPAKEDPLCLCVLCALV